MLRDRLKGGIKIPQHKNTLDLDTVTMGVPSKIIIPMLQHIGDSCTPKVNIGDRVKVGQLIGDSESKLSCPIYSSVSGTVIGIEPSIFPDEQCILNVNIEPDGLQELHEDIKPALYNTKKELRDAIRRSGIVGLGGAGFPTHIKLDLPEHFKIDTLIINVMENEPYLTSNYREIIEEFEAVVDGINVVADLLNVSEIIIGIQENLPEAIKKFKNISTITDYKVKTLKPLYPYGSEILLVKACTGKAVPSGKLPYDVGVEVLNVSTVSCISKYLKTGMPLIKRRITVDGPCVQEAKNVEVLIGTPMEEVFDFCGGFKEKPYKVLKQGPMLGSAQYFLDSPITKNTNAILALNEKTIESQLEGDCIRCGRCIKVCPIGLMPNYLYKYSAKGDTKKLESLNVLDCIECGSCSYICPSRKPIKQSVLLGKAMLEAEF